MNKILTIAPEKCTGCRTCELVCSFFHGKEFNPARGRVTVVTWDKDGFSVPIMCLQCGNPPCMQVCTVGAVYRDFATGAVLIENNWCIGCRMCTMACPFGNAVYDAELKRVLKCDLCGGDPQCAKYCPFGAISFVLDTEANTDKKRQAAGKFRELLIDMV